MVSERTDWDDWSPRVVENSLDGMEKKVRDFGGAAAEVICFCFFFHLFPYIFFSFNKKCTKSPLFIAELQGGWFNHYMVQSTYDQIYRYIELKLYFLSSS
jgi:hypothetical protein